MLSLLEKNLSILERCQKQFADFLRGFSLSDDMFKAEPAKNGEISLSFLSNGKWQALNSRYNPQQEASIQVNKHWKNDCDLYIIFGVGGFYHIEEVLSRAHEQAKILVIEPRAELFYLVLKCRDVTKALKDPRLQLSVGEHVDIIDSIFEKECKGDGFYIPNICVLEHPIESKMDPDFFEFAKTLLVNAYRGALADRGARLRFGDQWVKNILGNLPDILQAKKLDELCNAFAGKPAILVSAGPSLNKNIHLLKKVGNRALIVCVDTAYRALYREGVVPHMLVAVDGSESNSHDFDGVEYSHVPLVMEMTAHECIAANHRGLKFMLHTVNDLNPWMEKVIGESLHPIQMPTGGSVANTAFSVIEYLGCDPIIFVGQDLSYPEGKAYAKGSPFDHVDINMIRADRKVIPLKDIYENDVYTTEDYLIYLRWFEERFRNGTRHYVNATEGGALRSGVEILTLQEAIYRYCIEEIPIQEIIDHAESGILSESLKQQILREIRQTIVQMKHLVSEFGIIIDMTGWILEHAVQDAIDAIEMKVKMDTINHSQQNILNYQLALSFIDAVAYREIFHHKSTEIAFKNENLSPRERDLLSCRQSFTFATVLREVGQRSLLILEEYLERFCEQVHLKGDDME